MSMVKKMKGIYFNDTRLSARCVKILKRIERNPDMSFSKIIED